MLDASESGKPLPVYSTVFSQEEIQQEDRRPKRKVAVLLGYSGTGYRGMQLMPDQPTIEGDLFQAFVKAGAISKANADDPKKSALVRCARTDKGVHAAGNVISLKLIVEDDDIVQKINSHLPAQIRVWGYERTTGAFSCYAACDSRWYEYLIPTYAFLPPHPSSWIARQLKTIAEEDGQLDQVNLLQADVAHFWDEIEKTQVAPILDELDPESRHLLEQALYRTEYLSYSSLKDDDDAETMYGQTVDGEAAKSDHDAERAEPSTSGKGQEASSATLGDGAGKESNVLPEVVEQAIRAVREVYLDAKRKFRIHPDRLSRVRQVLSMYQGTHNFHNFTVKKSAKDPSARRFIQSFKVENEPVLINGTEWLSMKVHGQSFMMHQIRKMVALVAMIVRSGCPSDRLRETLSTAVYNIPKAPSLGLLLERPVFQCYNDKAANFDKKPIIFDPYEKEMLEFKQREIYDKIFLEEDQSHT